MHPLQADMDPWRIGFCAGWCWWNDVISCHGDAQHKAIIHATETAFAFIQGIWLM